MPPFVSPARCAGSSFTSLWHAPQPLRSKALFETPVRQTRSGCQGHGVLRSEVKEEARAKRGPGDTSAVEHRAPGM